MFVRVFACVRASLCVCVRERDRERERKWVGIKELDKERFCSVNNNSYQLKHFDFSWNPSRNESDNSIKFSSYLSRHNYFKISLEAAPVVRYLLPSNNK